MTELSIPIGKLARTVGCKVQTIRYYEQIGLLPPPTRTAGAQRRYGEVHRQKLTFVRHARELGFSLADVRELLALADKVNSDCGQADRIARRQLEAVRRRITMLDSLRTELERMLAHGHGNRIRDCRVIATLADHGLCMGEHPHDQPVAHASSGDYPLLP
ncbi:MAG TPA: helix-turn-helix domain-containing protein [Steroidobacteraceae bacterium]|nr:helix-turn-helix domain-containing protein [Steroidobacteraceae bacterium]